MFNKRRINWGENVCLRLQGEMKEGRLNIDMEWRTFNDVICSWIAGRGADSSVVLFHNSLFFQVPDLNLANYIFIFFLFSHFVNMTFLIIWSTWF